MTFFSRKHLRLLLLPALLLLTGCAGSAKETADSTENEKLSAVATIFPQYDFLRAIGGDHLDYLFIHCTHGSWHFGDNWCAGIY